MGLMKAIESIPQMAEKMFFRGLPASALPAVLEHYECGRQICWSGITSVSARSIRSFSAFEQEAEALLKPNFNAIVSGPVVQRSDGCWHLDLVEVLQKNKYKF